MRLVSCLALLGLSALLQAQDLGEGLLIHYSFQGNFNDSGSLMFDAIGTNVEFEPGPGVLNNSSAYFNGEDSYISLPQDYLLEPDLPVTISFWVKIEEYSPAVFTIDDKENWHTGIWFSTAYGTNAIAVNYGDGGIVTSDHRRTFVSDTTLLLNQWHRIVAIVRGPNDMDMWVGCHQTGGYYTGEGGTMVYSDQGGSLGRKDGWIGGSWYYFQGWLDEIMMWNRELTLDEIYTLCHPDLGFDDHQELGDIVTIPEYGIQRCSDHDSFQIFDLNGRLVMESNEFNRFQINLSPGSYILVRKCEGKTFRRIFVSS